MLINEIEDLENISFKIMYLADIQYVTHTNMKLRYIILQQIIFVGTKIEFVPQSSDVMWV